MRQQTMTRKELLAKKHESALIWRIILFSFFSLALIALVFYYAIPAMVKIADIWDNTRNSGKPVVTDTTNSIPLIRPTFEDNDNRATSSATFVMKGTAPAGLTVHLSINGQERPTVVSDSSGSFTFGDITLQDGVNTFIAYSQDERGRKSSPTEPVEITLDTRPPKLEVSSPTDGQTFGGARANVITVTGKTDEATQMYVNDSWIILKSDGSFERQYQLSPGENILTFVAKDDAGNESVKVVRKVMYNQ